MKVGISDMVQNHISVVEIARRLNLSRCTVDRVINRRGRVAPATEKRVRDMIEELGYEPNKAAKYLAKRQLHRIAVSYDLPDYFAKQIKKGISSAYNELRNYGVSVIIQEPNSFDQQCSQLEALEDIDALAISAAQPADAAFLVQRFAERDIPVITFNTDIPHSDRLCYVGCDYTEAGRVAAGLMRNIINPGGKVVGITAQDGVALLSERMVGFSSVIQEQTALHLLPTVKVRYEEENVSHQRITELLQHTPDIAGLFCTDVSGVICAAKALRSLGLQGHVKLIGYDLNDQVRELLEESIVHFTINQDPYFQGYLPLKILFDYLAEEKTVSRSAILAPLNVVFKENLHYYDSQPHIVDYLSLSH